MRHDMRYDCLCNGGGGCPGAGGGFLGGERARGGWIGWLAGGLGVGSSCVKKRSTHSSPSSSCTSLVISRQGCIWHEVIHLQALHLRALAFHLQAGQGQPGKGSKPSQETAMVPPMAGEGPIAGPAAQPAQPASRPQQQTATQKAKPLPLINFFLTCVLLFCFILDLAALRRLAMMRRAFLGSMRGSCSHTTQAGRRGANPATEGGSTGGDGQGSTGAVRVGRKAGPGAGI